MKSTLLAQKDLIESHLVQRPRKLSSLSFVNLFLWSDFFSFESQVFGDNLCVFAVHDMGTFMYLPPLGKNFDCAVVEQVFDFMRKKNKGRGVSRIENVSEEELAVFSKEKFSFFQKGSEYLYSRQDLVELHGQAYKSKRHDHNFFQKHYSAQYLPFTADMTRESGELYDRWAKERKAHHRDEIYEQMIDDNRSVHQLGMQYYKELGLMGRVVVLDGKIAAYTFGYELNKETFCVLFEVADLKYTGLPVYIFHEFCSDEGVSGFNFINVMDDFGAKNLEKAKLSFRPKELIPAYTISPRD
jgi:hypothetical protein